MCITCKITCIIYQCSICGLIVRADRLTHGKEPFVVQVQVYKLCFLPLLSGVCTGAIAAALTTPFDVAKTRVMLAQVYHPPS